MSVPDLFDDREWVPDLLDDQEWKDLLTCLERSLVCLEGRGRGFLDG